MNLFNAAAAGNVKKVKKLLTAGVPCDWQIPSGYYSGYTPLLLAAANGHREVVDLLLTKGSQGYRVNQALVVGGVYRTPLLIAVEYGRIDVVELLLSKGADLNQAQERGGTPLYIAAQDGHHAIVELLLSKGAVINLANAVGCSPLYIAAQEGHRAIVELLLSKGAGINLAKADGATPLLIAAQEGHRAVVELLLSNGADNSLCFNGRTPADIAALRGHQGIAELLLSRAASSTGSSHSLTVGPPTNDARALAGDHGGKTATKESNTAGGTEELCQDDELSRLVQGLRVCGNAPRRTCDVCGVEVERLKMCPCLAAVYCSAECQKQAWPSHKGVCTFKKK